MKIRILFVALSLVLFQTALCAQDQDEVMFRFNQELKAKSSSIRSIECDFTQTRVVSVLASDVVKKGVFHYAAPDNICLSFDDGDFIKMTESVFQMKNSGKVSQMKVSSNPFMKELKRLLTSCMTGSLEEVLAGFRYEIAYESGEYTLSLSSRKTRASMRVSGIVMVFEEETMSLKTLKMIEDSGDYTRYDFSGKTFNGEVDLSLFDIE